MRCQHGSHSYAYHTSNCSWVAAAAVAENVDDFFFSSTVIVIVDLVPFFILIGDVDVLDALKLLP